MCVCVCIFHLPELQWGEGGLSLSRFRACDRSIFFRRRRKQAEWGWERRAVAESKGPGGHLAASPGTSELGAATLPAGQDSIPPRKGSGFLSGPPQGKIKGLWHFPAFLIFNKTIVGGWPLCWLLGGSKPAHSRARGGASAAQPAGREQCLFVAGPRGSCGPPRPGPSP